METDTMFEGMDMNALLAQAQQMQADMMKAQEDQANRTFEGTSGGGLVTAQVSGLGDLMHLEISPEAWDPEDPETLAALVIAAFRAAKEEADGAAQASMPQMPSLPEGFGF